MWITSKTGAQLRYVDAEGNEKIVKIPIGKKFMGFDLTNDAIVMQLRILRKHKFIDFEELLPGEEKITRLAPDPRGRNVSKKRVEQSDSEPLKQSGGGFKKPPKDKGSKYGDLS